MPKEMIHDIAKQLFHEVIDEICTQLGSATVHARHTLMLQIERVCNEMIDEFVFHLIRSVSSETLF